MSTKSLAALPILMGQLRSGDQSAAAQLVTLFYPELRRLAQQHMRGERSNHTWQPTVLVNELYLELSKLRGLPANQTAGRLDAAWEDERRAFLGLAVHIMKRLLIHHARPLRRRVEMREFSEDLNLGTGGTEDLALVENLLGGLEKLDPQLRTIVEMRVLEGFTMEEIAEEVGVPLRTVYRRWTFARTWLAAQLEGVRGGAGVEP